MNFQDIYYPETRWGGFTHVDGTIAFYTRVNSLITPSSVILDVGCGRGNYCNDPVRLRRDLRILKGKCLKVIGIDVDEKAASNPALDEFSLIKDGVWPIRDLSVDLCLADWVLEHVREPELFFRQCQRVLKPGGYVCIRTPNILSYFGLVTQLIPQKWRCKTVVYAQDHRETEDIFPAVYRCNSKYKVRQMMLKQGFDVCICNHEAEPSYLSFSQFFYFLGVLHQRIAPDMFKLNLFIFGRKR